MVHHRKTDVSRRELCSEAYVFLSRQLQDSLRWHPQCPLHLLHFLPLLPKMLQKRDARNHQLSHVLGAVIALFT